MLSQLNKHIRDSHIVFQEAEHIYHVNGKQHMSVTTLIHQFFPHFNADKVITNMMRSPKFKFGPYAGMTPQAIKDKWENEKNIASSLGTSLHKDIELYINGETPSEPNRIEFKYFLDFWFDVVYGRLKPYRTEWMIYSKDGVAGSIDCVLVDDDGDLVLIDWKRSKEIKMSNTYERGYGPFRNLDNCNYNHYTLQLNIYRHILETEYNHTVIGMFNVILHPNNDSYVIFDINRMDMNNYWSDMIQKASCEEKK